MGQNSLHKWNILICGLQTQRSPLGSVPFLASSSWKGYLWCGQSLDSFNIYFPPSVMRVSYDCVWSGHCFPWAGPVGTVSPVECTSMIPLEWKGNQSPCRLNYDIVLRADIALRQDSENILLPMPAEDILLLMVFINRYTKNDICQIHSCIAGSRERVEQQLLDNVYDNLLSLSKFHLPSAQAN